ncbi:uncharacterized protein MONOS_2279 [Monocercomonoides exilis]|uniref:uncharacterized protein n=1 Tax=Monocercomonoides exilis TaxID=2049356 RepID=UPI00355A640A|nr:hypothetical protein MONOS_2279 [Monocercomonoides exilis]|eukprot:MONOS_2279.1-p1 / transcript=MONOS_2279.1 / gene=MONOS_2279 / organism=Monocercomonoides_exilis_PA203 / gene_product=unspecified product / transcript_product=unspecified product / location=Mono_scaffold00046:62853-63485(+) / protein_length=211 / sequence_SO=supercontig / SO=protein_coding / is_pseudo=false
MSKQKPATDIFLKYYSYTDDDIPLPETYEKDLTSNAKMQDSSFCETDYLAKEKEECASSDKPKTNAYMSQPKMVIPTKIQPVPEYKPKSYVFQPSELKWQEHSDSFYSIPTKRKRSLSSSSASKYQPPFSLAAFSRPSQPIFSQPTFTRITVPTSTLLYKHHIIHPVLGCSSSAGLQAELDLGNSQKYRPASFHESAVLPRIIAPRQSMK